MKADGDNNVMRAGCSLNAERETRSFPVTCTAFYGRLLTRFSRPRPVTTMSSAHLRQRGQLVQTRADSCRLVCRFARTHAWRMQEMIRISYYFTANVGVFSYYLKAVREKRCQAVVSLKIETYEGRMRATQVGQRSAQLVCLSSSLQLQR